MKATELEQKFQSLQDELNKLVNYNELEFIQLFELVNKYLLICEHYASLKGKTVDVHQRNILLKELTASVRDKKQLIKFRREASKMIKNIVNSNIKIFISDLANSKMTD
jgi:hypothetical protein